MTKTKTKKEDNSIERILDNFKNNLSSVELYFDKFGEIAVEEDEGALKKHAEFIDKCFEDIGIDLKSLREEEKEEENNHDQLDKNPENSNGKKSNLSKSDLKKLVRSFTKPPKISEKNFEILSSSSFLVLNNYFEYLLTDLLTYYYFKYKNSLNSKELKVSLKELGEYESIEELEKSLIYKEVESMLVELTFDGLLSHFKDNLSISLVDDIINWEIIKECRERRHIIVHNASIVNKKYLTRTSNPDKLKINDKINISNDYFKKAITEFKIAGLLLCFNCWGKWDKDNIDDAISQLMRESFESLQAKDYNTCLRMTTYAEKITARNENQEDLLLRIKFNQCIANKHLHHKSELENLLKTIKVGTATPLFKLAHAILSDKKQDTILELIEQTQALGDIDEDIYTEWPLFEFLRVQEKLNVKILKKLKN